MQLEEKVEERTKDLKNKNFQLEMEIDKRKLAQEMLAAERKKRLLTLIEGEEKERRRIAKGLHDGLGQKLAAAKLGLGSLLRSNQLGVEQKKVVFDTKTIIEESINEVREVSNNLTPAILVDYGLVAAVSRVVSEFNQLDSLKIELNVEGEFETLSAPIQTVLYRIFQEALSNAIRHAKATDIKVELLVDELTGMTLEISDNGIGFDFEAPLHSDGLSNIKERCSAIGAEYSLSSEINNGTRIIVKL